MRRELTHKRVLITGASSGIGRALACAAAKQGMRLVLAALETNLLNSVADELREHGAEVVAVPADVTDPESRRTMFAAANDRFGGLDILVNNAGVGCSGHFVDQLPESLRQVMEVNFFAAAENCRLAIPWLSRGSQPLIVNVSSMFGRRGVPDWAAYSASKFALCGFSEALRAELARYEIDLLLVLPGVTATNFGRNLVHSSPFDIQSSLSAEEVAQRIIEAMKRNKSELHIGRDAQRLLWLNRLAPRLVDWRQKRLVRQAYAAEAASLRNKTHSKDAASPTTIEARRVEP